MKFTIMGFQQIKLIENNLNVEDAFILRVIKDLYSSASMEFKNFSNNRYMWINYTYLLSQIPIIGTKRSLMRRIEKYSKNKLILRKLINDKNGIRGKFSYIAPTQKLDSLEDFDNYTLMTKSHKGYDKIAQPLCQNRIRVMTKSHNKDNTIIDNTIIDNNIYSFEDEKEIFDYWNSKGKTVIKSGDKTFNKEKQKLSTALKTYSKEEIKKAIDRICICINNNKYYYNTRWNLFKFVKQANGISNWTDDGQYWNRYLDFLEESKKVRKFDIKNKKSNFTDYQQRDYDFTELEKKLLGN